MYRRLRIPSIWREMDQLQREMNRLMDSSYGRRAFNSPGFPAINIWTSEDGQVITAELPGFTPEDIDIDISADKLTLSGERNPEDVGDDVRYHRQERNYGKFVRSIQLPFMVDTTKVDASMKDGVLEIALQRAEADKPKKIAVKKK
ncbi:MAG: Hsp20/alpha crystallin family protein [Anaerolineales bacterium]|jgi:HSP20 family protein